MANGTNNKHNDMKKYMLTAVMLLIAGVEVSAQVYDTIHRRSPNYYYTEWYDEDSLFYVPYPPLYPGTSFEQPLCFYFVDPVGSLYQGIEHYTTRPLEVKGLSCMVSIDAVTSCSQDRFFYINQYGSFPEHMYIYQRDAVTDSLVMLDSVRWDTVAPKILELPRNYDSSSGSEYCYVYEAMLEKPVTVNGRFFIASSNRNWTYPDNSIFATIYRPFVQVGVSYRCSLPHYHTLYKNWYTAHGQFDDNFLNNNRWYHYGPYFAIVDRTWQLGAESADTAMGFASGAGYFVDSSTHTIQAIPKAGYKFTHWNDGDTANPRLVLVTGDTLFTAYFRPLNTYYVTARNGSLVGGHVEGGGTYLEDDVATLVAQPWLGYGFVVWNDGDTTNPRQVVVTQDTLFTASFERLQSQGIAGAEDGLRLSVAPNPADGSVVVTCGDGSGEGSVTVRDLLGKVVKQGRMYEGMCRIDLSDLPDGIYYLTLTSQLGTATRKLLVR